MKKRSPFWRKAAAVGADLVFLLLAIVLGFAYLRQPQRASALDSAWRGIEQFYGTLRGPSVLIPPPNVTGFQGERLAIFGDNLEFLGCDVAIMRDREGTHVWHLTLWRTLRPVSEDYHLVLEIVPADGTAPLRVEHPLGRRIKGGEVPTSHWQPGRVMVDATLLPEGVDPSVAYRLRIKVRTSQEESWLAVDTPVLEVDSQGWLMICE